MAEEVTIGGSGELFVGEDKTIRLELFLKSDPTVAVDFSAWVTIVDVRSSDTSTTVISSITPSMTGVFNAVRVSNTQRGLALFTDDELNKYKAKNYRWSWKRLDEGSETVLAWGDFSPEKATAT